MKGTCDSFKQFLNGNRGHLSAAAQTSGKFIWKWNRGKRIQMVKDLMEWREERPLLDSEQLAASPQHSDTY